MDSMLSLTFLNGDGMQHLHILKQFRTSSLGWRLLLLVLVWALVQSPAETTLAQRTAVKADPLSRYLQQLELDGLLIEHLERRVNREQDRAMRLSMADELATRYTEKLLKLTSGQDSVAQWQDKAKRLLELYPSLESPMLRVAMFHARYVVNE